VQLAEKPVTSNSVVFWRVARGEADTAERRARRVVAVFIVMIGFGCVCYNLFMTVVSVWPAMF
jgi:hypothetical protein